MFKGVSEDIRYLQTNHASPFLEVAEMDTKTIAEKTRQHLSYRIMFISFVAPHSIIQNRAVKISLYKILYIFNSSSNMIVTKTLACIFQEPCHLLKTLDRFVDLKNLGPFSAMKEKSNSFGAQTNSSFIHPTTHVPCFLRTPYCSRASFPGAFLAAVGV